MENWIKEITHVTNYNNKIFNGKYKILETIAIKTQNVRNLYSNSNKGTRKAHGKSRGEQHCSGEHESCKKKKMKMQREQENPTTSAIIETKYCTEIGKNHTLYLKIFT